MEKRNKEIISGVYRIYNIKTRKSYVGSAKDIDKRLKYHFSNLRKNKHHSIKLQLSWNMTIDKSVFTTEILETVEDITQLKIREQIYIDKLDSYYHGYNCSRFVDNPKFSLKNERKLKKKQSEKEFKLFLDKYKDCEYIFFNKRFLSKMKDKSPAYQRNFIIKSIKYFEENYDISKYSLSLWWYSTALISTERSNLSSYKDMNDINLIVIERITLDRSKNEIISLYKNSNYRTYWEEKNNIND